MSYSSIADFLSAVAVAEGRCSDPLSLCRHQTQVYSQNGEDGIIAEIFRRIGTRDRCFVEIGVENGVQNNTRFLLEQGWRGVWIDLPGAPLEQARENFGEFVRSGALTIAEGRVTAENVNALLDQAMVPAAFDFLSLDIDQNTSHVWRAAGRRYRAACVEYNASIPASLALEVPYDPAASWDGSNWFGGSLKALERIAGAKGLSLVGCELTGANAFFVDTNEASGLFQAPFTAEQHWQPPRYPLVCHAGHPPSQRARRWV